MALVPFGGSGGVPHNSWRPGQSPMPGQQISFASGQRPYFVAGAEEYRDPTAVTKCTGVRKDGEPCNGYGTGTVLPELCAGHTRGVGTAISKGMIGLLNGA